MALLQSDRQKWHRCLDIIRDSIGEERFNTFFSRTKALGFSNKELTLWLPSHFYYEKYEQEFYQVLYSAIKQEFGEGVTLGYKLPMTADSASSGETVTLGPTLQSHSGNQFETFSNSSKSNGKQGRIRTQGVDSHLNPLLTFENYCLGHTNLLPVTIAKSIAEKPRNSDYNPFFLYGDVGVGKTHLIQSIGNRIKELYPSGRILFTTMRDFQHLYATAVINKDVPKFINWFMQLDVLLLDDLQEIANKSKTAEALFPIFNHLHQNGKQLVFTCDRPPMELEGIADRMIDRFKWGLTERLPRPDEDLRRKILSFKANKNGLDLPQDVMDYIAANAITSVREIEGVVMGMYSRSINLNVPIDLELAKDVMKNSIRIKEKKTINFEMIVEATAEFYNLNPDAIFSKSRMRDINDARQVIMYLSNKLTGLSSTVIGRKLNRGHGTVLHGINAIKDRLPVMPELSKTVSEIEKDLMA